MKRFVLTAFAVAVAGTVILTPSAGAQEQQGEKNVLVITGDLNRPYEILDGILIMKTVTSRFTGNPFQKAVSEAFAELMETAAQAGGDAVINTWIQTMLAVVKGPTGDMGEVIIMGTVVKFKTQEPTR